jgi:hypothetical protein
MKRIDTGLEARSWESFPNNAKESFVLVLKKLMAKITLLLSGIFKSGSSPIKQDDNGVEQHKWRSHDGTKWKCERCEKIVRTAEGQTPEVVIKQLAKISEVDRVVPAALYPTAVQFCFENNGLNTECSHRRYE